jgi:hypothetical protein
MLARHTHTFLRVDGAFVRLGVGADEDIFELDHARVGEKQRGVPARDEGHRGHGGMSVLDEEIDEILTDLVACKFFAHVWNAPK